MNKIKYILMMFLYTLLLHSVKQEINANELPKLRQHAEQSGNQMDIQSVADMEQFVDRLDKNL